MWNRSPPSPSNSTILPSRPLAARSRNPERIAQAVTDRAEFADGRVTLRRPADHLGGEIGLMAAADDDVPILGNDLVDCFDDRAGVQHAGLDVEGFRIRGLGRDAVRELFRAYRRRRRFAGTELPVEAGKDRLDADQRVRSDVEVGGRLTIAQAARGIIQLNLAGPG